MRFCLLLLFCGSLPPLLAQDLSGVWSGYSTQEGVPGRFFYEITIRHAGKGLEGSAVSKTADGKHTARFTLAGSVEGEKVNLQEIAQVEPLQPQWCLKFATLNLSWKSDSLFLDGVWLAQGCRPGRIFLSKTAPAPSYNPAPTHLGQWTGHLSQSDRPYGFFYQVTLDANGAGQSYIVSEGSGGSARHHLKWQMDAGGEQISIQEDSVWERTDARWKWCIKSATLRLRKETNRWVLEGDWQGHIEGRLDKGGACAPGMVFLEKPMLSSPVVQAFTRQTDTYAGEQGRKVIVGNVIEVAHPEIRIRIWDNGVVDGDVATLFLNGKRILNRHKVAKYKYSLPIKLEAENNVLVLHAESLGSLPPNTVAVSVYDGVKEQIVVVCSNLEESGAILIRTFRME